MARVPSGLPRRALSRQSAQQIDVDSLARSVDSLVRNEFRLSFRGGTNIERIANIHNRVGTILERELRRIANKAYRGWRRALIATTRDIPGRGAPSEEDVLAAINARLARRTWRQRLANHRINRSKAIRLTRGKSRVEAAQALMPDANRLRARASTLARTEAERINQIMRDRASRDVLGERLVGWRYVTARDDRVRASHRADDRRLFRVGERRIRLPRAPNCRCYYLPVVSAR